MTRDEAVKAGAQALHRAMAPLLPWSKAEQWERVAAAVIDAAGPFLGAVTIRYVEGQSASGPYKPAMPAHYVVTFPDGSTKRLVDLVPVDEPAAPQ